MSEDIESYMKKGRDNMKKSLEHLNKELAKVRTGKASPAMLEGIMIEYYGTPTPLNQVANVGAADSRTITVQPWDKSIIGNIEQAIFAANLGITPQNDGEIIRITIPPLTEERRVQLVKQTKSLGEEARVSIRQARHKMLDFIKSEVKEGYPEDAGKRKEKEVEDMVHEYIEKVDKMLEAKEEDIMKV